MFVHWYCESVDLLFVFRPYLTVSGLRFCVRMKRFPIQTPLGARLDVGSD